MNNDPTHEISVETFDRATGFNIGTVRIRTVAGDSYTGCHPSQQKMEPKTLSPPKSTNVHFKGVSNFEILKIELDTVHGDAVDLPGPHNGGTGVSTEKIGPSSFRKPRGLASQNSVPVTDVGDEIIEIQPVVQQLLTPTEDDIPSSHFA